MGETAILFGAFEDKTVELGPTPTKIVALRHRTKLVAEFLRTITGLYNPPRR